MNALERVGVLVEKMVESCVRRLGHVGRRPIEALVRRVDQMEGILIVNGRERPRKIIDEAIKKDLDLNGCP